MPDLGREGWRRVRLEGTDLAFEREGEGVLALRAQCGEEPRDLESAGRELWIGIRREGLVVRDREVGGWPALEIGGRADGVGVRAVVIRTERCLVDVAHVRPGGEPDAGVLERLLGGLRFEERR